MSNIPSKYRKYKWIIKRFKEIKNVEIAALNKSGDDLTLFLTNNMTGDAKKVFSFPLQTKMVIDYTLAPDCLHEYDIMELDDPMPMVQIGLAKAENLFSDSMIS